MKAKIIVLLLFVSAVIISGCVGGDSSDHGSEENVTETEVMTPEENVTATEVLTPEESATATEVLTPEVTENETTTEETETPEESESGVEISTSTEPETYLIRIQNYIARPSSLDIKVGDSVSWINLHDNPKRTFILVSEDGLFENKTLAYRRIFNYAFNETGSYNFSVIGQPRMNVEVNVTDSNYKADES